MNKNNKINISIYGRSGSVIVQKDCIKIYRKNSFLLILSMWFFGFLFFLASSPINNMIFNITMSCIGGAIGVWLPMKFLKGKNIETFYYEKIESFISNPPDLTISLVGGKQYSVRAFPKAQVKLLLFVSTQMKQVKEYKLVQKRQIYKVEKINQEETAKTM